MTVVFGKLTNVFGGFQSPGSSTVYAVTSTSDFNSQVTGLALKFVYIGIGVLSGSFLGTFFWTLSGERISRRIRGYRHPTVQLTIVYISKPSCVRTSLSLIDLAQERSPIASPTTRNSSAKASPTKSPLSLSQLMSRYRS